MIDGQMDPNKAREEDNATQIQEENYQLMKMPPSKSVQLSKPPNFNKSQVLNFDNITMREEVSPVTAKAQKSQGNIVSSLRRDDVQARENADLQ